MVSFISDVRMLYKRWSVQFAILAGLVLQQLATNPQPAIELVSSIEPEWFRRLLVFLLVSGVPILLSALRQPKLAPKGDA